MGNEDELQKLHQHDKINLLYSNSYAGMLISMIASGTLAFGFYNRQTVLKKYSGGC